MEGSSKAILLATLILADGFLTWASIEAGGANAREANALFEDTPHAFFLLFAGIKAFLWIGAWALFKDFPKADYVTTGLTFLYSCVFVWNLGNFALNL